MESIKHKLHTQTHSLSVELIQVYVLLLSAENGPPKDVYALIPTTSEYLVTWQMGTKVADGIKVADQLT